MITVEEYDDLVAQLRSRPIRAEFTHAEWARLRPENIVALEAVVEAVEDLIAAGHRIFTVAEVKARMDQQFFDDRLRYQGPRWSTIDNTLRKIADAGLIRLRQRGRPGGCYPRIYEAEL